jgi:hypothetical protein
VDRLLKVETANLVYQLPEFDYIALIHVGQLINYINRSVVCAVLVLIKKSIGFNWRYFLSQCSRL